jgi:hypothetical protein
VIEEHGYFGNIWVRQHYLDKAGDQVGGHAHYHDHVSLLTKGSVTVQVDGYEAKTFHAPTFIVIRKEHRHTITALENETVWYCVFALRNLDGEVTDVYDESHDPLSASPAPQAFWKNKQINRTRKSASN